MGITLDELRNQMVAYINNGQVEMSELTRLPEDFKHLPDTATGQMILREQAERNRVRDLLLANFAEGLPLKSFAPPDPHPWLRNARAHVRMLRGEIDITHAKASSPVVCRICNEACIQQTRYLLSQLDQGILEQ